VEKSEMNRDSKNTLGDTLHIIWTIASKDIADAIKNKTIISMIVMLSLMLLLPKLFPLIFEQPGMVLPVLDMGDSTLIEELSSSSDDIAVQKLRSEQEMQTVLCSAIYPLIGLQITSDFKATDQPLELQGYVCWGKRNQVSDLQPKLVEILSQALGQPVTIHIDGNIVYPPSDGGLFISMATVNSVLLILMMGIFLIPHLLFEEKETKTMQVLLVSPASIGQVVIGKALAGAFYILVTAVMIFAISWADVIHWDMVLLFVISGGIFSVAVGLILGSFFEKQQDIVGWISALMVILLGTILVKVFGLELPTLVENILPWMPSVALAEICNAAFSANFSTSQIWTNLWVCLSYSLPLYALAIWKIRRSDR